MNFYNGSYDKIWLIDFLDVTEKHASRNLDSKREYASVKYNYDDDMTQSPSVLATKEDSGEDETFRCPSSLKVPPEITMVSNFYFNCIKLTT